MARPTKKGLSYFPLDVGFRKDIQVRLLLSEFGPKGLAVLLSLWELCYGENGYYAEWSEDTGRLLAQDIEVSFPLVQEVLAGCLRRSLFDQRVFQEFSVLTSSGIQKRYLMAMRDNIARGVDEGRCKEVYSELWLLTEADEKEIFRRRHRDGLLRYINYPDKSGINPGYSGINPNKSGINPLKSKEESVKRKEERGESKGRFAPPSLAEVQGYVREKSLNMDAEAFFDHFTSNGWRVGGKTQMKDWKAAVRNWARREQNFRPAKPADEKERQFLEYRERLQREREEWERSQQNEGHDQ